MSRTMYLPIIAPVALASMVMAAAEVDPQLQDHMRQAQPGETVQALLYLHDQLDINGLEEQFLAERATRAHRHQIVVETLQATAEFTQGDLLADLKEMPGVESHQAFWIANVIHVDASVLALEQLSHRDDIMLMYLDHPIELVEPVDLDGTVPGEVARGGAEAGVAAVRAPECWAAGFDGTGVLVANIDTGVDGSHIALASRWAGTLPEYAGHPEWAFLDPYYGNHGSPYDSGSHGTHTMGTVCGGSPGLQIGVAPGAHWMASAGIDQGGIEPTVVSAIQAFEWMIDPDGVPSTSFDVPSVCSNSWGLVTSHGYPECDQTFWTYLDACELAGTVILFSAGNEGSSGLRRPGDRATDAFRTCAVAAIDPYTSNWDIASFSSRGPTYCTPDGSAAVKPDIAAPGVNTYSSVPGNSYSSYSGTSMASPHVNGVVAIMRQANPDLPVEQVKQIIYDTAYDLGSPGEDNDYGHGMIDAWEALQVALSTVNLSFDYPAGRPDYIEPNGGQEVPLIISGPATPQDGSGLLHYSADGGAWMETALVHLGDEDYMAIFPGFDCGAAVNWYLSIETSEGEYVTSPYNAPSSNWLGHAWSGQEIAFEDDFQSDAGWTVSGDATTGAWQRAEPNGGGTRCDPPSDADGSGSCYVTQNGSGDTDIDDGSTILTSPMLSAPDGGSLAYRRWYNNGTNCGGADPQNDVFIVEFTLNGGLTWYDLEIVGPDGDEVNGGWISVEFQLDALPGFSATDEFQLRFTASDLGEGSIVEAGVDAILIDRLYCDDASIPGDANGDGKVNVDDILAVIAMWGSSCSDCTEDLNGDGTVDVNDLLLVIANW
ncbi:MAG: S8 family serine peptidase [Planctomycetota bacterium]|nr:S8 family serine peptidase [Planctomycetota bacterium]